MSILNKKSNKHQHKVDIFQIDGENARGRLRSCITLTAKGAFSPASFLPSSHHTPHGNSNILKALWCKM